MDRDRIRSEISQFKSTQAYAELKGYLEKRIASSQNILTVKMDMDLPMQVAERRGVCDTAKRILNYIDNLEVGFDNELDDGSTAKKH